MKKLVRRRDGRAIAAEVAAPAPGVESGTRFKVLGDSLACGEDGVLWTGVKTGHFNTVTTPRKSNKDPLPLDVVRNGDG